MGILDSLVGRLTRGQSSGPYALSDEDRQDLKRNGLLQAGLAMLSSPSNGMQGVSRGLLAGLQGVQEGADQLVNDRYRTDVMERTRSQMEANTAREQAMQGLIGADGKLDQAKWASYAQTDPLEALRLRQQIEELNAPKMRTPNPTRTRIAGRQEIQEEFDPITGQWSQIGVGERWGNSGGGGGYSMPKPPSGYRWAEDGALAPIPGGPADPTRAGAPIAAGTVEEQKASGLLEQALMATDSMRRALADDKDAAAPSFAARFADSVPFGFGDGIAQSLRTDPQQRYNHGAEQMAEVALRLATGAGVNQDEARQKIRELTPQIGDSEGLKQQKMQAMDTYLRSLGTRAGRALTGDQRERLDSSLGGGQRPTQPSNGLRTPFKSGGTPSNSDDDLINQYLGR